MWKHFESGSSATWESNDYSHTSYGVTSHIVDLAHTLSNVVVVMLPMILMHVFRDYGGAVIHNIQLMLMAVGLCNFLLNTATKIFHWVTSWLSLLIFSDS